jgi:hypothetical protein
VLVDVGIVLVDVGTVLVVAATVLVEVEAVLVDVGTSVVDGVIVDVGMVDVDVGIVLVDVGIVLVEVGIVLVDVGIVLVDGGIVTVEVGIVTVVVVGTLVVVEVVIGAGVLGTQCFLRSFLQTHGPSSSFLHGVCSLFSQRPRPLPPSVQSSFLQRSCTHSTSGLPGQTSVGLHGAGSSRDLAQTPIETIASG